MLAAATPDALALLALMEAVLFVATIGLANARRTKLAAEYVGTAFHLLLLPIIAALPLAPIWQATGLAWVVCDIIASIGMLWTARWDNEAAERVFNAIRMAGHLFAGIWIACASIRLGPAGLVVGGLLALSFVIYTLAAGRLPEKALAVPGVLMAGWLLLLAHHFLQIMP